MLKRSLEMDTESYKKEFKLSEDDIHVSYLHPYAITPGTTIVESKNNQATSIFNLPLEEYKRLLFCAKNIAQLLCKNLQVNRCALLTEPLSSGPPQIKIIPLHGIDSEWKPILSDEPEYFDEYPGYYNSKNGPLASDDFLDNIQSKIRSRLETSSISYEFFGEKSDMNLFSSIVRGELKQWRVWEDSEHVAFLTPYPNIAGFTVIVPRKHLSSDIFSLENNDYDKLIEAGYKVSYLIKQSLSAEFSCMIFEGFEIDYAHIKIIPIVRSKKSFCKEFPTAFHPKYIGYISSLNGPLFQRQTVGNFQKIN